MMNGYGWCLLRARAPDVPQWPPPSELREEPDAGDGDQRLWANFRIWMEANVDPFMMWDFAERTNNDSGVLIFSVSRNHRASGVWAMLAWIAEHGPGSYGLFFVHDDEDELANESYGRGDADHSNRFRVHRVLHGRITEMEDPFFGRIRPWIDD